MANTDSFTGTASWTISEDDNNSTGIQTQEILQPSGSVYFTPLFGEKAYLVIKGTDSGGNKVYFESEPYNIQEEAEVVFGSPDFILPASLTTIEENAFEGLTAMKIVDAHNCTFIGNEAFKGTGLTQIKLPKDCEIDAAAFGEQQIYVFAQAGGTTEEYCDDHDNLFFIAQ